MSRGKLAWSGTLKKQDYPVLAYVFGFKDVEEFLDFAALQQAKEFERVTS